MTVDFLPSLSSIADWIRKTDDDAVHHLALLERVEHALRTLDKIAPNERRSLTQKLERWRYQHLNEHEAPGEFEIPYPVSDDQLIRLYSVLRLAFPEAELVLSTREPVELRNRLAKICITQLSAGSSTAPGGYQASGEAVGEQFPVIDDRSSSEVANWLEAEGFRICWRYASSSMAASRPISFRSWQKTCNVKNKYTA
jgi:2-iminoacetate synthase ThiH